MANRCKRSERKISSTSLTAKTSKSGRGRKGYTERASGPVRPSTKPGFSQIAKRERNAEVVGAFNGPNRLVPHYDDPIRSDNAMPLLNVVNVSPQMIDKLSANFDEKTKGLAAFLLMDLAGVALSYEQAAEYAMIVLRDVYKIDSSIRAEVPQLLGHIAIAGMIAKSVESMTSLDVKVRNLITEEFIVRFAERSMSRLNIVDSNPGSLAKTMDMSSITARVTRELKDMVLPSQRATRVGGKNKKRR